MLDSAFQEGSSFIHRSDPRIRLVSGLLSAFTVALLKDIKASFIALCLGIFSVFVSSLPLRKVIKAIFVANLFILFLWIFVPFSTSGDAIFRIWKLSITWEGIRLSSLITLKCNAILLFIIAFIGTIPIPTIGHALSNLGFSPRLTLILLMSYRYIHVIFEEYKRLSQALQVRCFRPKTNLHTYKTYAYLIAMIFVRSYERGIRVYQAMLLRGFNGRFHSLRKFNLRGSDIILFSIMIFVCGMLFLLDRGIL